MWCGRDRSHALEDLSPHRLREIENSFQIYKELEGRAVDVFGWLGSEEAWRIIDQAVTAGPAWRASALTQMTL